MLLLLGAAADSNEKLVHEQAREQCEIIMNTTTLVKRSADSARNLVSIQFGVREKTNKKKRKRMRAYLWEGL